MVMRLILITIVLLLVCTSAHDHHDANSFERVESRPDFILDQG